eukprot:10899733-Prorocentrum_lima.AAC.1
MQAAMDSTEATGQNVGATTPPGATPRSKVRVLLENKLRARKTFGGMIATDPQIRHPHGDGIEAAATTATEVLSSGLEQMGFQAGKQASDANMGDSMVPTKR